MPSCKFGENVSVRVDIRKELHAHLKAEAASRGMHLKDLLISVIEGAANGYVANAGR